MDTKRRILCLDADSIVWNTAYLNQTEDEFMIPNLDFFLSSMFTKLNITHYAGFLGGPSSEGFRKRLFPSYKSNRPPKPEFLISKEQQIRTHLVDNWKFQVLDTIEADDAVSILAARCRKNGDDYVIGGIDKDLKQIPGEHYNYVKSTTEFITPQNAEYLLFNQVLVGDSTDKIGGCPGVGKVKAIVTLGPGQEEWYSNTIDKFIDTLGMREGIARFAETYLLVRLLEESDIEIPIHEYKTS